jgi:hypothetical protein
MSVVADFKVYAGFGWGLRGFLVAPTLIFVPVPLALFSTGLMQALARRLTRRAA